jgi:hypothetical protein
MLAAVPVIEPAWSEAIRTATLPTSANEGTGHRTADRTTASVDHGVLVLEQHFHPPVFRVYSPFVLARRRSLSRIISVNSSAGRISKGPAFTPGCFDINWMA